MASMRGLFPTVLPIFAVLHSVVVGRSDLERFLCFANARRNAHRNPQLSAFQIGQMAFYVGMGLGIIAAGVAGVHIYMHNYM